jgi:hypothetical protein
MEECRMTDAELEALVEDAKLIEWEEYVLQYGPRAFGPDDDLGLWHWEVS